MSKHQKIIVTNERRTIEVVVTWSKKEVEIGVVSLSPDDVIRDGPSQGAPLSRWLMLDREGADTIIQALTLARDHVYGT